MVLGTIEIFALIIAVVAAIKILVILIKPSAWMKIVKTVYSVPVLTMVISLILAGVVLYYLVWVSGMTIVDIFAVMLLIALLGAVSMAAYSKDVIAFATKMLKDRTAIKKAWLAILIWIILIIWVLYVLFA